MHIGLCTKCKYIDLIMEGREWTCQRCDGMMKSLNINSSDWNQLSDEDRQRLVDSSFAAYAGNSYAGNAYVENTYTDSSYIEQPQNESVDNMANDNVETSPDYETVKPQNSVRELPVMAAEKRMVTETGNATATGQTTGKGMTSGTVKVTQKRKFAAPSGNMTAKATAKKNGGSISGLSIAALVLSILCVLSPVGLILGIIDLVKKDGRKRVLSVIAIIISSLSIIGAIVFALITVLQIGNGPQKLVGEFSEAMKAYDLAKMNECLVDSSEDVNALFEDDLDSFLEYSIEQGKNIQYEIVGVDINGSTADVTVKYTYTDASKVILDVLGESMLRAFESAFADSDEEQPDSDIYNIFKEKIEGVDLPRTETVISLSCEKVDGNWKISDLPVDIINVMTCNMVKGFEEAVKGFSMDDADTDYDEEYIEEDYTGEEYTDEDYTDEEYTEEDYTDEEYSDEELVDEEFVDEEYIDEDDAA